MIWPYLHGWPSIFVLMTIPFQATYALSTGAIVALSKRQGCSNLQAQCESESNYSDCVDYICNSCRNVDPPVIDQCCAGNHDTTFVTCLETGLDGGLGSGSAANVTSALVTSALPTSIANDPNYIACNSFNALLQGFCYSSETYAISVYDGYFSSCQSYILTGDTSAITYFTTCSANAGALSTSAGPTTAASNGATTVAPAMGNGGFLTHAPSPSSIPSSATAQTTSSTLNTGGVTTKTSTTSGQGKIQVREQILIPQTPFTDQIL